jgi:hypothetical protein
MMEYVSHGPTAVARARIIPYSGLDVLYDNSADMSSPLLTEKKAVCRL